MNKKVSGKVLVDFKKYQYLLGLQSKNIQPEDEVPVEAIVDPVKMNIDKTDNTSVSQLANMQKELMDNTTKLQNIAQQNTLEDNSTIQSDIAKSDPKLTSNAIKQTKIAPKKRNKNYGSVNKKVSSRKRYREEEVLHNGIKWYRLK
jgi:flagellar biogenesis protein FliO